MLDFSHPRIRGLAVLTMAAGGALALASAAAAPAGGTAASTPHRMAGMDMSPAAMQRQVQAWYASHPAHGGSRALAAAADTFLMSNFRFDADGSTDTQIDTVKINAGQSVLFKWVEGFHTTTSGNPGDPDAGSVWDQPIDSSFGDQEFTVTLDTPGTYPFFCQPHGEFFNMKGAIVVRSGSVGVPAPAAVARLGFTRAPAPNPTQSGIRFEFATAKAGVVRAEVFDAAGRKVAIVVDRALEPGVHSASWNGRGAAGASIAAGVYYLRLQAPDIEQTRRISIER